MKAQRGAQSGSAGARHGDAVRYRSAIADTSVAFVFTDADGRLAEVNPAFLRLFGYISADEVIGRHSSEFTTDPETVGVAITTLHAGGRWGGEVTLKRRDGSHVRALVSASAQFDDDGKAIGLVGSFTDLTDRWAAEAALRESESRFRLVMDNVQEVTWMTAPGTNEVLYVSPAYETIWQRSCASLYASPRSWIDVVHPADRSRVMEAAATRQVHGTYDVEYRLLRTDGSTAWVRDRAVPVRDAAGEVYRIVGVAQDITREKQVEMALAARARQQAAVVNLGQRALENIDLDTLMHEAVLMLAATLAVEFTKVLELAPGRDALSLRAGFGWRAGTVGGERVEVGSGSQAGFTLAARKPVIVLDLATETRFDGPPLLRAHGIVSGASVIIGDPSAPFGILGVHTAKPREFTTDDVHFLQAVAHVLASAAERQAHELALVEREAWFRSLIEHASDSITVVDRNGVIRFQSPSSQRTLGMSPEALVGRNALDLIHPDDAPRVVEALTRAFTAAPQPIAVDFRIRRNDGSWLWSEAMGRMLPGDPGDSVVVNSRDVTERRRLEQQFLQAQKLDAVGQLSAGIAHDFNNVLTVIAGNASLMDVPDTTEQERRDALAEIHDAVGRASSLTRQLLTFSGRRVLEPREIELNPAVADMARMLRRVLGERIEMEILYAHEPLRIHADPGMVDQVILNLAVNARDAMSAGGQMTLTTAGVSLTERDARHSPGARAGLFVRLSVADTGGGIAPELLPRIFEPFFTTKPVGRGTGLGLATVHSIMEQHKGWVTVDSEVGKGTTFHLFFPRLPDDPTADAEPTSRDIPSMGTETILVAEDDADLRLVLRRTLDRLGYQVLTAASAMAAEEVWSEHAGGIDLLLTDLVMPDGMNGLELGAVLRHRNPELRVICMSGYQPSLAQSEPELPEGLNFLEKPFDAAVLSATVRAALDAPLPARLPANRRPLDACAEAGSH